MRGTLGHWLGVVVFVAALAFTCTLDVLADRRSDSWGGPVSTSRIQRNTCAAAVSLVLIAIIITVRRLAAGT